MRAPEAAKSSLTLAIAALSSVLIPAASFADEAEWTLMVYLDSDNNLELAGIYDFLEIASVGSSGDVQVVVLMDRVPQEDDSYGNWTDTRRGLVRPGDVPSASWGESIGEANMGDPDTLVDFAQWAMQSYPAARYGLVLWDHGNGWWPAPERMLPRVKGVCWDDTSGSDGLSVKELREALATITSTSGPLDLIGFDACLMSMVEVAYDVSQYASVMVAAETSEPGRGWPYDTILAELVAQPSMTAADLGADIVDEFEASVHDLMWEYPLTLSAIDLSQMANVADGIDALAEALRESWNSSQASCAAAAGAMMTALDAAVIHEKHWPNTTGPHGLAVYFPEAGSDLSTSYRDSVILLPGVTQWDEFLQDFRDAMGGSWVAQARDEAQECDEGYPHHVDLYDFCSKLLAAVDGDSDGDGISDSGDNCTLVANAGQTDTDGAPVRADAAWRRRTATATGRQTVWTNARTIRTRPRPAVAAAGRRTRTATGTASPTALKSRIRPAPGRAMMSRSRVSGRIRPE